MDTWTNNVDCMARECIAVRLRLLNRVITNLYDDALRPLGLKTSQLNILIATAKLGLARPTRVCEVLQLDASTLSRNVERMRKRGWLEIVAEEDGRAQPFRLTPSGKKLLEKAFPLWERGQKEAKKLIGDEGLALLSKTATTLGRARAEV